MCSILGERKPIVGLAVLAFVVSGTVFAVLAFAATEGSHDVIITITEINALELTGGDITLTISDASMEATDSTCSLCYATNSITGKKITAVLNSDYPTGITLYVTVASVGGASQGEVELTNIPTDVIRDLEQCSDTNQTITYRAVATMQAGVISQTRTVTYTITDQ